MNTLKYDLRLAMSIAFSWGSAIALMLGMQFMSQKGIDTFIMWAIPNALCLSVFGFLVHHKLLNVNALDNPLIKIVMILLQIMVLLFQMKLLQGFFEPLTGHNPSYILTTVIGLIFVWWMYKRGLISSIITDNWQGAITLLSLLFAASYCFYIDCPMVDIKVSDKINWLWPLWTTANLCCAVICDLQHWRRAEVDVSHRSFYYASGIFACLVFLIGCVSVYQIPQEVRFMLIIPVLGLATSTIDSIAVAMHECVNKTVGSIVASLICVFWWAFMNESVFYLWNSLGVVRITISLMIVIFTVYWYIKNKQNV